MKDSKELPDNADAAPCPSRCYADRVGNFTPIHPLYMATQTGLPIEDVMKFFDENFGGYAAYVRQCEDKEKIGKTLATMTGDESA